MKKFNPYLFLILLCFNCQSDDAIADVELLGNWQLIEIFSDPGDGSGSFSAVDSNKIVTFNNDGTVISNGTLCSLSTNATTPSIGLFIEEAMTFATNACGLPDVNYEFEIDGNTLIIYPFCFEGCAAKYQKL